MYKTSFSYTSFSRGEISPELFGRGDFAEYYGSAMTVKNMRAMATGGLVRRAGTMFAAELPSEARLVQFEYSSGSIFLLALMQSEIWIFNEAGAKIAELDSPWTYSQIQELRYAQKGAEIYLTHPNAAPQIITYSPSAGTFSISQWKFKIPIFARYASTPQCKLTPAATGNKGTEITLYISGTNPFSSASLNKFVRVNGCICKIKEINPYNITVELFDNMLVQTTDEVWEEAAFDDANGYPTSVTFHQNRLVIGGAKAFPNRIWFSKTGDYLNFSLGTGLDDEAIEFDMLSDKANEISCVFSGRHLQIFTSDGEWIVSGSPLTPTSVSLREQTKVGSSSKPFIAPKLVEGSTIFVAKNGREIREFVYGETEGGYSSSDLIALSPHLLDAPFAIEYDVKRRMLYALRGDGKMAVLVLNKAFNQNSWSLYETAGEFMAIANLADKVWTVAKRGESYFLEYFNDDVATDCSIRKAYGSPVDSLDGLSHLEGQEVAFNADMFIGTAAVSDGEVALPHLAKNIYAGLAFEHIYAPLPVFIGKARPPKAARLLDLIIRVKETPVLEADAGGGIRAYTGLEFTQNNLFDTPLPLWSGDARIRAKGWITDFETPLFKIQGSKPVGVKILNITTTVEIAR